MKIEIRKITNTPKNFTLNLKDYNVNIIGNISKLPNGLFKINATITGGINLICDLSGEEFIKNLNEDIILYSSYGIWKNSSNNNDDFDVIEFFDSFIDLDFIFRSELESMKLDYHTKN